MEHTHTHILSWPHRDMEGFPSWGISSIPWPPPTEQEHKRRLGLHTIHALIHSNKANMKGWLWRPNDIRGPCGPKTSWHLSYRWGKTPKKPHQGNLSSDRDRTRAHCVTDAHGTACSTALLCFIIKIERIQNFNYIDLLVFEILIF